MKDLVKTDDCVNDIKSIIEQGRQAAYSSVNLVMIHTYWNVGRRIVEEEQNGSERAEYGKQLLSQIAIELKEYGDNFSERNLRHYRQFYLYFNNLQIWYTRVPNLKWSHYRTLLRVADEDARIWYMKEANEQMWSVRTLDRNISTQYYYRLLQSPKKEAVIAEMQEKMRCYVLVDLKMGKVTHQDVGQMDMYVRMYDDLKRKADENPTIGILLCAETSEDIARYSVLHDSDQLFMAKYLTYMPSNEQLRAEIEKQKEIFYLQHPELKPE